MVGVSKIDGPWLATLIAELAKNGTPLVVDFEGVTGGSFRGVGQGAAKIFRSCCFAGS